MPRRSIAVAAHDAFVTKLDQHIARLNASKLRVRPVTRSSFIRFAVADAISRRATVKLDAEASS